jgi:1-acyl-sn-glycerol-3-phosphate acyltransferase
MNGRPFAGVIAGGARFIAGVNVSWKHTLPEDRQTVFFANHTSHLDFVVLWASLPARMRMKTRPVAAQDYWSSGVRKWLAVDVFNAILVSRHGNSAPSEQRAAETIDRIADSMGEGYSIIIFPEGTRGDGEAVAPFKSGLYHLCQRKPHLQLVPVYMENLNRILPKGEFLPVPFISRVNFGQPTAYEIGESKAAFLERMRDGVCALRTQ